MGPFRRGAEETFLADARFRFNQSIIAYFNISFTFIITHFNLIHGYYYVNIMSLFIIITYYYSNNDFIITYYYSCYW